MVRLRMAGKALLSAAGWFFIWSMLNFKTVGILSPLLRADPVPENAALRFAGLVVLIQVLAGLAFPWTFDRLGGRVSGRAGPAVASAILLWLPTPLVCAALAIRHPAAGELCMAWALASLAAAAISLVLAVSAKRQGYAGG